MQIGRAGCVMAMWQDRAIDAPPPGFVRVMLACRACGWTDVCDLQPRAMSQEGLRAVWRCFACGERAEPPAAGARTPAGGPGDGPGAASFNNGHDNHVGNALELGFAYGMRCDSRAAGIAITVVPASESDVDTAVYTPAVAREWLGLARDFRRGGSPKTRNSSR
jgi:hypothetical protein